MTQEQRSLIGRLLTWVNVLLANAAALVCVLAFVKPSLLGLDLMGQGRVVIVGLETTAAWVVFVGALCLLGANVLWLARGPRKGAPRNYVLSEAQGGAVRISRDALESGLRATGESLPEITRLRVLVDTSAPRKVVVHGQFQCPEGVSNLEASRVLREALARRFQDMVRLTDGGRVEFDIEFVGFAGKMHRRGPDERAEEPEPAPFTGPKYPIDAEEGR